MERSALGSYLRTSQALCQQVSEKYTLDFGIAFFNHKLAGLPEANQIREVTLESPDSIPAAFDTVNRFFAEKGLSCLRWAPTINVDPQPLGSWLAQRGYEPKRADVFRLEQWVDLEPDPAVRVLPARAMRSALADVVQIGSDSKGIALREKEVACILERLDDPQMDLFVAMADKGPVGRCGLYQVGDIARITDLFVLPSFAGRGVDRTLLAHVLALAKRLAMPLVLSRISESDGALRELFTQAGFVADGRLIEFDAPSAAGTEPS